MLQFERNKLRANSRLVWLMKEVIIVIYTSLNLHFQVILCQLIIPFQCCSGATYGTITTRIPILPPPKGKPPVTKSLHRIQYNTIDLSLLALDQLVSTSQTRCIADAITFAQRQLQGYTMRETMEALERIFDEEGEGETVGLGRVHPEGWIVGFYARPRRFEIAAAMSRLREMRMRRVIDGHDQEQIE